MYEAFVNWELIGEWRLIEVWTVLTECITFSFALPQVNVATYISSKDYNFFSVMFNKVSCFGGWTTDKGDNTIKRQSTKLLY